jgi:hypothetical protein
MRLSSVVYKLLDGEAAYLDSLPDLRCHELGCEVRLNFHDAPPMFVTWADDPCQFCVGLFDESQFKGVYESRDLSGIAPWREMIGHEITLTFLDTAHQVLRVGDDARAVFLSSMDDTGGWQADVVRVTDRCPE